MAWGWAAAQPPQRWLRRAAAGLLAAALSSAPAVFAAGPPAPPPPVQKFLQWVLKGQDNEGAPFAIIDKQRARLWLFDASGGQRGSTPVLLGLARGDVSVPGIGDRPMGQIKPHERTTPAGRFVAEPGRNTDGEDIFWVDYDAAVSLHRVRPSKASERRLQRLATNTAADNRISYGCINVPVAFYERAIEPLFSAPRPVVYLLPETMPASRLFKRKEGPAHLP